MILIYKISAISFFRIQIILREMKKLFTSLDCKTQHHLQIPVDNVARMYVLDRLKKLIHDEDLVDVLEDVASLNDVVKIGFWGNGPKRVSGQKSENRRT